MARAAFRTAFAARGGVFVAVAGAVSALAARAPITIAAVVRPDVWGYAVSGMQVLPKWLGYRTRKGAGRAVTSTSDLDRTRPEAWPDEWNDELLDLIRVLTLTLDRQADLADLLDRVCEGPLIPGDSLPVPDAAERQPPPTAR